MNLLREYVRPLRPGVLQITRATLDEQVMIWDKRCRLMGLTILAETGAGACYPVLFDSAELVPEVPTATKTAVTQAGRFPVGTTAQGFNDGDDVFGTGTIVETPDRILVIGADDMSECGIYEMTAQGLVRPTDADADADFAASFTVQHTGGLNYAWLRPVTGFTLGTSKVLLKPDSTVQGEILPKLASSLYMFEGPSTISHTFDPGLLFEKGLFVRYASDWEGYTRNATGYWQTTAIIETQRA